MTLKKSSRSVFITGGTGSVGEALVEAFAAKDYRVTFQFCENESRATQLRKRFGAKSIQIDFERDFTLGKCEFDVVVNNAAINISDAYTHRVSIEDWNRSIRVNLTAPFLVVRKCLPFMIRRRWGRIINISSIYGLRGVVGRFPYTVTKHGLSGFTKTVAKEYANRGISCNEICSGPIDSNMMRRIATEAAAKEGGTAKGYLQEVCGEIPAGRMVHPSEVANLALFLASAQAAYITGASIPLDGGMIA